METSIRDAKGPVVLSGVRDGAVARGTGRPWAVRQCDNVHFFAVAMPAHDEVTWASNSFPLLLPSI